MAKQSKQPKLKVGDLVYLKNVGFPYHKPGKAEERYSWEGASCLVTRLNAGYDGRYVEVAPLYPMVVPNGHIMETSVFHPEQCVHEDRPWLKHNAKRLAAMRELMIKTAYTVLAEVNPKE